MLLLILLAVLGQTVDYSGNYNGNYTTDYSYPQHSSVLGKNYTEAYNGGYTHNYSYAPENYTKDYYYAPENYTKNYSYMHNVPTGMRYCQAGFFLEGSSCKPCPVGFTSYEHMNVCTACAAGKTTESTGSPYCYNCPDGKTSFAGKPGCYDCPAGTVSHSGSPACTACEAGKFSVAGAYMCEPCWAGSYSEAGAPTCQDCPQGTTSMQGSPSLSMCMTMMATSKIAPINDDDLELVDDLAKGPIANAMELHNEAQNAQERAEEAQRNAEQEEAEAKDAYEQKMVAEEKLHFAEEQYEEAHSEKRVAEEAKFNAVVRYEDEAKEAENAEKEAEEAKQQSERAALRAFEASHAVKMQSEGEANEAVVNAKREQEEQFQAELEYQDKLFEAEKETNEAEKAEEQAQQAAAFAEQQIQEAHIARAEVQVAESHRDIQKAEAKHAQNKADMALREHKLAEAHHENVIASKQRNEEVWDDMLENDCVDDPMGLVVNDPSKNCDDVGSETHWSCDHFDEDFNGHKLFIWEICPVSCNMCGANRDHYYEEHHHKEDEEDRLPECLDDCPFDGLDIEDPVTACPWWQAEGPEYKTDSCFNDCSPGVMLFVEHHVERVCHGGPDDNPLECAMDCPIENLDPHSAESFCPWFSEEKDNDCFHDCSDKFLNMAQAHAEHTCYEYEIEGDKYINYISEPIAGSDGQYSESSIICEGGYYRSSMTEAKCTVCPAGMFSYPGAYECSACPSDLTSFPGAKSSKDCFVRASLKTDESYDKASYESEDKSEDKEWETAVTVEPINYNTQYPSTDYYNEDISRAAVDPSRLTYNNEDMPSVYPTYSNKAYETEPEYYTSEPSNTAFATVEKYDYSHEPEYNTYQPSATGQYEKYDYSSEPEYNTYEPSAPAQYDHYTSASDYYYTATSSFEDYPTGQPTDYSPSISEFVDKEHVAGQSQYGVLTAPPGTDYSPYTNTEGESELLSGSGH